MCTACEDALIALPNVGLPASTAEVTYAAMSNIDTRPPQPKTKLRRAETSVPMATLVLQPQQSVRILDHTGRALLDILWNETGPVLQLAGDADLDVSGALRISAQSIDMLAHDGAMRLMAKDDVIVRGEKVRLN